ncbi:DUF5977 domain-containing protein [Pedobacter sp. KR3-3]|uniref:DUF5977 domain-containing protein n=1 Tax=Pedobacter albus TaxID=3113905 RepID=A0ABU7I8V8_9SPHI|nr:DUF5977 domain-containing protein [Pedobacter sp. KR3-3]MEE1945895.1 DUF5977 domain-containing protein [Pedobacter sp. KR3-3]
MKFWTLLILIFTFFISHDAIGQNVSEVPKAPEVASLNKYIDFPVNKSTGTTNIDIPLYNLVANGFSLPISLSYHTGGIKVSEVSGVAGLGWSLNVGGTISRSIKGLPDENYYAVHGFAPITVSATAPAQFNVYGKDLEPDVFYFNVNGYSGKFVMDKDHRIHLIPEQDIKIELDTTVASIETFAKWILITPDGNRYNFEGVYDHGKVFDGSSSPYDQANYINAWHLSSIITTVADTINFQYKINAYHNRVNSGGVTTLLTTSPACANCSTTPVDSWISSNTISKITSKNIEISFNYKNELREDVEVSNNFTRALDNIEIKDLWSSEIIKNIQLTTSYFQSNDNIAVSPSLGINSAIQYTAETYQQKRLRLDEIKEMSGTGISLPSYKFSYNKNNAVNKLPNRLSNAQDHWGYYNGQSQNLCLIGKYTFNLHDCTAYLADRNSNEEYKKAFILDEIVFPTGGITKIFYDNLIPASNYPGVRVKKIMSVSGETAIVQEKNYIYSGYHITGGLPIYAQRPTIPDALSWMDYAAAYGGDLSKPLEHAGENGWTVYTMNDCGSNNVLDIYMAMSNSVNYTGELAGNYAYYDQVVEYQSGNGSVESNYSTEEIDDYISNTELYPLVFSKPALNAGKLLSEIYKREDGQPIKRINYTYDSYYRRIIDSKDAARYYALPCLETLSFYDLYTGSSFLIKKEEISYEGEFPTVKTNTVTTTYEYNGIPEILKNRAWASLPKLFRNAPLHHLVNTEKVQQSDGSLVTNSTKYVFDYFNQLQDVQDCDISSLAIEQAIKANMVTLPVEQLKILTKNSIEKIIGGSLNQYQLAENINYPKQINLKQVRVLELPEPLVYNQSFNSSIVANGGSLYFKFNSNYKTKFYFDFYDQKNNVLQYHETGKPNSSVIWGYKQSLPIAKAINATLNEIYYQGFEESKNTNIISNEVNAHNGANYYLGNSLLVEWNKPNSKNYIITYWYFNNTEWKYGEQVYSGPLNLNVGTAYDDICIYPEDAQMLVYNYKPSAGISSITDIRSQTTYYSYDGLSRLSMLRDYNKDIMKAYIYHYKEATSPFFNVAKSITLNKNNCPSQAVGSTVTYTVPAGRYTSPFSQKEADDMALKDISENGQSYVNNLGECTGGTQLYYNVEMYQTFTAICNPGQTGDEVGYGIDPGEFSSAISQADANAKAYNKLQTEGQRQANQTCHDTSPVEWESTVSDNNCKVTSIKFYNVAGTMLMYEINASQLANMYDINYVPGGSYKIVVGVQGGYYNGQTGYKTFKMQVSAPSTSTIQSCQNHPQGGNTSNYTFNNVFLGNLSSLKFLLSESNCN